MVALSALLAGLGLLVLRRGGGGRLDLVLPREPRRRRPARGHLAAVHPTGVHPPSGRWTAASAACALGGVGLALLLARPVGLLLGLALAVAGPRLLRGLEPAGARAHRAQLATDLPLLLDLLSSCLAGGAALPVAARAVAAAVPGPAGQRLGQVCAQLAVGTPPAQAWSALTSDPADVSRPRRQGDPLGPAARALGRAAEGGAPVAAAVARLAGDARAQSRAQGELAARRVGVLVVAPLGLCFLPAFVLLGVVPVVAGLVAPLLATF